MIGFTQALDAVAAMMAGYLSALKDFGASAMYDGRPR